MDDRRGEEDSRSKSTSTRVEPWGCAYEESHNVAKSKLYADGRAYKVERDRLSGSAPHLDYSPILANQRHLSHADEEAMFDYPRNAAQGVS
jgi:hypothetical protein